ncbi:MAG: metal ABC transporter ATP-binding protein [Cellulosilyticaceae bacterium]
MSLITCQNTAFSYDGKVVVQELNFEIQCGDYLCIVGENGAGKSTLIKGLLGLKKPNSGNIRISDGLTMNEIGYLPQQTHIQKDFPASVYEVVLSGTLNSLQGKPFYGKKEKTIAITNMERLDIINLKNKCYRELSGGQQQRVLLARALCATKKVILLDEPATGLDPIMTNELYKLIANINHSLNITVIMVSHDIQCAVRYANCILHLYNKQLFFGSTENYLKSEIGNKFIGGEENV